MRRIISNFFLKYKDIILLFLLSLTPLLWYGTEPNNLIFSNDVGYPLNPLDFFKNRLFAWNSAWNFGSSQKEFSGSIPYYGIEALFTYLTGSVFTGQKVFAVFWFFLILFSMYFLIKKIPVFNQKPYMTILAAILFGFNHFQLFGWRVLWVSRFSTYAALPLVFLLLTEYFENRRSLIKTSLLIGLVTVILNGGGSPPVFGVLILLGITIICYYLLINIRSQIFTVVKKSISLVLLAGFVFLLFSFYWVLPYLRVIFSSYNEVISSAGGPTLMLAWTDVVSANTGILNLIRLQGMSFWGTGTSPTDYQYLYYKNPFLIFLSFMWPILAFSAIFLAKKTTEKKYLLLFSFLAVVGLVFSAGSHEPFRGFYIFLLKTIPGFPIFRSPIYKFGGLLWFAYAVLIAFSLSTLLENIRKKLKNRTTSFSKSPYFFPILLLASLLLYNFPFFNSKFFNWNPPLTMMEKIPKYVLDFGKWTDNNKDKSRMLLLPDLSAVWRTEVLRWGYWSPGTVTYLLTLKNALTNDGGLTDEERKLVDNLYETLKKNDKSWVELAKLLSIKNLLLKKDFFYDLNWGPSTSPTAYEKTLTTSNEIERVKTFGEWELYQLTDKVPIKKFFPARHYVLLFSKDDDTLKLLSFLKDTDNYPNQPFIIVSTGNENTPGIAQKVDDLVVSPEPANVSLYVKKGDLVVPKPRFLPGFPLYFLIENKEKELIQKTTKTEDIVTVYLGLTLKRLGELKEFINVKPDLMEIQNVLGRYNFLVSEILKNIDRLDKKDSGALLIRTRTLLEEEENLLGTFISEQKDLQVRSALENMYKSIRDVVKTLRLKEGLDIEFSPLEKDYKDQNIVLLSSEYQWSVPTEGKYEIYVNNSSIFANGKKLTIEIDSETITKIQEENKNNSVWQNIGEIYLTKGSHGLKINTDGIPVYSFKKKDIVFFAKGKKNEENSTIKIDVKEINPTKYKLLIRSEKPFSLVFNERFDRDWKLYFKPVVKGNKQRVNNLISNITNVLYDGIFDTLSLKAITEDRHFKVNGYANAWDIDSKDIIVNNEFEVIIEYWPQRLFYLGFAVTVLMVFASGFYLVLKGKKS